MRLLLQCVKKASVRVDGKTVGFINKGLLVFLGVTHKDTEKEAIHLASKLLHLRVFSDALGKMNLSLEDIKGEALIISQFTKIAVMPLASDMGI